MGSEPGSFRRRHRSAMSPAAFPPLGDLPWHGIDSRPSEDLQAKLRSRHKSSIDDRRLTIDIDDSRDLQGSFCYKIIKIMFENSINQRRDLQIAIIRH